MSEIDKVDDKISEKRAVGRPKGMGKTPNSGRVKGTLNKSTRLKNDLIQSNISLKHRKMLLDELFRLGLEGSGNAARTWLDHYQLEQQNLPDEIAKALEAFDSIQGDAIYVAERIINNKTFVKVGVHLTSRLLAILIQCKEFKAAYLSPERKKLLEDQHPEIKH